MGLRLLIFFLLFVLLNSGQAQVHPRLVGGIEAAERFPSIFIFSDNKKNFTDSFCTATKISSTQFLTAAHCVLEAGKKYWFFPDSAKPGRKYYYSFSRDLSSPVFLHALTIKRVSIHPLLHSCLNKGKYAPAHCTVQGVPTPDVAIITVEKSDGPFFDVPFLPIDFRKNEPGDEIILTGYGSQFDGDVSPPVLKYGFSRVATIEEMGKAIEGTSASDMGFSQWGFYFGSLGPLMDPNLPNLGSGDSGGPVIKEFPDRIVGINSSAICPDGAPSDCEVTSNNFFARIDAESTIPMESWIREVMQGVFSPEK
jgi:hypothetical protein